ncbi:hypothetical protein [Pelosinus sp. IPA-1]|uniref:hypothetical protein n=1 Tax=Pelosinus sp. IPA-1 TaxID=3029569 RepID=UPI002555D903|nr:hypothetical protein [Pelosinus sp. IPA-1]
MQKGWLIPTLVAKVGIAAAHLSQIEGKIIDTVGMKTLPHKHYLTEVVIFTLVRVVHNLGENKLYEKFYLRRISIIGMCGANNYLTYKLLNNTSFSFICNII